MGRIIINYQYLALIFVLLVIYLIFSHFLELFLEIFFSDMKAKILDIANLIFIVVIAYYIPNIIAVKDGDIKFKNEVNRLRYLIRILIFIFIAIYAIVSLIIKDPIFGVASATILGLSLGLSLQPILLNLFSGLIILSTGFIKVGNKIRIISSQVPYVASTGGYKYFSDDAIPIGYKGTVEEISIFYSLIRLESGVVLKVPNSVVLLSGIIEKLDEEEIRLIKVRFEFPIEKIDEDKILEMIEERVRKIKGVKRVAALFSEQSDKEHVIIELKVDIKDKEHKVIKSQIIKELIKIRKNLKKIKDKD